VIVIPKPLKLTCEMGKERELSEQED